MKRAIPATIAVLIFFLGSHLAQAEPVGVDVRSCGAVGDGITLNTAAIQKAVDTCSGKGGGTVNFPAGRYLCGTILLKDNVTLHLDPQAVLLGSTNAADYAVIEGFTDAVGVKRGYCLLGATDAKNIGIEGGTVDGQGKGLMAGQPKGEQNIRPFLLRLLRCNGVSLKDVHLQNSAAWTTHLFECTNVKVDGVTIFSHGLPNNDGFDIDSCQGVSITNCDVDTGDDALCLKATSPTACRDVTATGCKLKSNCGAIKLGTESLGDFDNIRVSDCQVRDTGKAGIKLCSMDGSHLQNVTISNITMDNVIVPIFIRLGSRLKTFRPGDKPRPVGIIKNVLIKDIHAAKCPKQIGIVVSGIPGYPVEDVTLENIDLQLPGGGTGADAQVVLPEKEASYPEIGMFGPQMPAYAVVARHAKGLKIKNLKVELAAPDARPAKYCLDLEGFEETGWQLPSGK